MHPSQPCELAGQQRVTCSVPGPLGSVLHSLLLIPEKVAEPPHFPTHANPHSSWFPRRGAQECPLSTTGLVEPPLLCQAAHPALSEKAGFPLFLFVLML